MPEATRADKWRAQMDECRKKRDNLLKGPWQTNVAFRVQRPFTQTADQDAEANYTDQISVPADWSRSRSKTASLWSQLPRISLEGKQPQVKPAVPIFEQIMNHYAPLSGVASVMEECCADIVNAAGVCAAMMKYEATFEQVMLPAQSPGFQPPPPPGMMSQPQQLPQAGPVGAVADLPSAPDATLPALAPPQTAMAPFTPQLVPVTRTISERYRAYRISPANLLWPSDFRGSDWQRARWLGYDGALPWAKAKYEFHLEDEDKTDVCSGEGSTMTEHTLAGDASRDVEKGGETVRYSEIFYWACLEDPEEKRYDAIRRIVFVKGKDDPVIDEDYTGQKWVPESGQMLGCTRLPIEVTTLTYVSDRAIPPSDSEVGRPQVLEQMRSRSQMIMQRTRNLPVRTFDINRVDPQIADLLMRGIWQGMIPTNGPGERVLSQIAAAAFPHEDFTFDQVSNRDLDESWSMSPNQMGTFNTGERSAAEAKFVESAYASVIGFQRSKVVGLFLGLMDTLMGLLQLNLDDYDAQPIVGPDGVKRLQAWNRSMIAGKFVATIRQDSTVLQDSGMRVNQLMKFLNIAGKSGRINIDPILAELAALSGIDPATVMLPPAQPKPEPMNLSARFSGVTDLLSPIVIAAMMKAGQAPGPQDIEAAKQLILDAMGPPKQMPANALPGQVMPWQAQALVETADQLQQPSPPAKDWAAMPRVTKRPEELGG